jgi:hypothetical protein
MSNNTLQKENTNISNKPTSAGVDYILTSKSTNLTTLKEENCLNPPSSLEVNIPFEEVDIKLKENVKKTTTLNKILTFFGRPPIDLDLFKTEFSLIDKRFEHIGDFCPDILKTIGDLRRFLNEQITFIETMNYNSKLEARLKDIPKEEQPKFRKKFEKDFLDNLNRYDTKYIQKMSKDNIGELIVKMYTFQGYLYMNLNALLRSENFGDLKMIGFYYFLLQAAIAYYSKFNNLSSVKDKDGHFIVYRGSNYPESYIDTLLSTYQSDPRFIMFREFISTSTDIERAKYFMKNTLLQFELPMNTNELNYFALVKDVSDNGYEKEILISTSCIFEIINIRKIQGKYLIKLKYVTNHRYIESIMKGLDKSGNLDLNDMMYNSTTLEKILSSLITNGNNLRKIDLSNNKFSSENINKLIEVLINSKNLQQLRLRDCNLRDSGVGYISTQLSKHPRGGLINLDLTNNNLSINGIKYLCQWLLEEKSLKVLNLSQNYLDDKSCECLVNTILNSNTLEELYLDYNNLGVEGVKLIVNALVNNQTLKLLDLSQNFSGWMVKHQGVLPINIFGDVCDSLLAKSMLIKGHEENLLDPYDEMLDAIKASEYISELIEKNTKLEVMDLSSNRFGNTGLNNILKALEMNKTLISVDLSNNDLNDEGYGQLFVKKQKIDKRRIELMEMRLGKRFAI